MDFRDLDALLMKRISLAFLPTPIQRSERLSKEMGVELSVKRDDLTESVASGNKIRRLEEYLLYDARKKGYDTLITWVGFSLTTAAQRPLSQPGWECRVTSFSSG